MNNILIFEFFENVILSSKDEQLLINVTSDVLFLIESDNDRNNKKELIIKLYDFYNRNFNVISHYRKLKKHKDNFHRVMFRKADELLLQFTSASDKNILNRYKEQCVIYLSLK